MQLSKTDIENMREGGRKLVEILAAIKREVRPGVSLVRLEEVAQAETKKQGGIPSFKGYQGYPAATCLSVNEQVVHCIPDDRILKEGDIITVDFGLFYKGLHTDAAVTFCVGKVSPEARRLLRGTYAALLAGTDQARPGNHVNDISAAIDRTLKANRLTTFRQFTGHGVGARLHQEPIIPNFSNPSQGMKLVPNMAIAIEPIVGLGSSEILTGDNGWNVSTKDGKLAAQFEHTVLITETGYEIITPIEKLVGS
ncbi:type I methionyl aminopeptidase [candidate division Kazan bacterium]|uniref:Methionine aminopeptidase n=1 Tax=candidate division Kazan bacterium TaxID=2202143 RepID=A0A420ZE00_UNCK3|nr:MAG: type I methionyl aminopeptidase [candidate division Kazan bacterium]